MKKTTNVKATKLMVDDHVKLGGNMCRITNLTYNFGRKGRRNRVRIHLHRLDERFVYLNLEVPAKTTFTIFNQK